MKIKVINYIYNKKRMHLKQDAELGLVVKHLKEKYGNVEIHSVYPEDGPMVYFHPPSNTDELYSHYPCTRCLVSILMYGIFFFICYLIVQHGYYKYNGV